LFPRHRRYVVSPTTIGAQKEVPGEFYIKRGAETPYLTPGSLWEMRRKKGTPAHRNCPNVGLKTSRKLQTKALAPLNQSPFVQKSANPFRGMLLDPLFGKT